MTIMFLTIACAAVLCPLLYWEARHAEIGMVRGRPPGAKRAAWLRAHTTREKFLCPRRRT
jgi:hypothetical protein